MESDYNLQLMKLLDEEYTKSPSYGSRRLTAQLRRKGHKVNRKRIVRLMQKMGIEAIHPKPKTSKSDPAHKKYPYLLRNIKVDRADFAWCSDITYIRMNKGFIYLTVVMDWFSRYVISWRVSISLESDFCVEALEEALLTSKPEIFNSDQGVQYTSNRFTEVLNSKEVKISMAGKGRCLISYP